MLFRRLPIVTGASGLSFLNVGRVSPARPRQWLGQCKSSSISVERGRIAPEGTDGVRRHGDVLEASPSQDRLARLAQQFRQKASVSQCVRRLHCAFEAIGTIEIMRITGLDFSELESNSVLQIEDVEVRQVREPLLVVDAEIRLRSLTANSDIVVVIRHAADVALRAGLMESNVLDVCHHVGGLLVAGGADAARVADAIQERIDFLLPSEAEELDFGSSEVRAKITAIDLPELKRRYTALMPAEAEAVVRAVAGDLVAYEDPYLLHSNDLEDDVARACPNAIQYEHLMAMVQCFRRQYALYCKESSAFASSY